MQKSNKNNETKIIPENFLLRANRLQANLCTVFTTHTHHTQQSSRECFFFFKKNRNGKGFIWTNENVIVMPNRTTKIEKQVCILVVAM